MKTILTLLLFVSAVSFAQTDVKAQYKAFEQEFEAYRDNPEVSSENSTIKPAPCGQYTLKYMITGKGFDEIVTVPPARKLCFDLNKFDKSKNPKAPADWEYEIKPVGNRYYVIRAEKKGAQGVQEFYYYERAVKK
ncbi:MAG TPA: hypothetical protein VGB50_00540 [Flavobacterium sp.]|jgi:hypothetical protein